QHGTTLPLRDDRRLPPCLGAQHPAGRDPALFDHLPYDGPSPSIGFDLRSAAQRSPAVAEVCYPFGRTHGRDGAVKRREFIALLGGAAAGWPLAARAQQAAMPLIGYLNFGSPESDASRLTGLRRGLNQTGYVEGRNFVTEYRWAGNQADRLP